MGLIEKSIMPYGSEGVNQHILINYTICNNGALTGEEIHTIKTHLFRALLSYCDASKTIQNGDIVPNDFLRGRIDNLDGKLYVELEIINPGRIYRKNKTAVGSFIPVQTPIEAISEQLKDFENAIETGSIITKLI